MGSRFYTSDAALVEGIYEFRCYVDAPLDTEDPPESERRVLVALGEEFPRPSGFRAVWSYWGACVSAEIRVTDAPE